MDTEQLWNNGNGREKDNGTTSVAKQQILSKREQTAAARERLVKQVSAETFSIREWTVLFARAVTRVYKEHNWGDQVSSVRESVKKIVSDSLLSVEDRGDFYVCLTYSDIWSVQLSVLCTSRR
jgi:hypothetical protein